jgi:D-inositol-3-phosphate glycosyltransferase
VTGLLSPPGDAVAFAAKLETLLADAEMRTRMGEAGKSEINSRYSFDRLAADIRNLYMELLRERNQRA